MPPIYKKAFPHGSTAAPPSQSCVMYFCLRESPRSSQRALRDSRRHPTTINPAVPRLRCSSASPPRIPDGWWQPPLLSPERCQHPHLVTLLPADRGGGGGSGQVPTPAPRETYLSIIQPGVIQSSATLEKANLNEPSTRNKTKSAQRSSEHQVTPAFSYKDLIQL